MRRKKYLTIITVFCLTLFLSVGSVTASAASLSQITKDIKEKQAELREGQAKEKDISTQMLALEQQIDSARQNIGKLETAIADAEAQLAVLEKELEEAQAKVDTQSDNLGDRLRNMYKSGSVGFLDVLLDSGSFTEFLTNLDLVEKIYASDKEVLTGLQEAYTEIEEKKAEVETLQAELSESKQVAEEEKVQLEADAATVAKQKAQITASNDEIEKMVDDLQSEADRITQELQNANNSSSSGGGSSGPSYSGGKLAWPVPSSYNITSPFGWRKHPILGYNKFHSGIDIGAGAGRPVIAAEAGTVYSAGWNGGYGKCVIINHGGGLMTLYAHNSSLLVSKGQRVSRGQQIAKIGTTGLSSGNHLHFEVRVNGNYKNPVPYVQ